MKMLRRCLGLYRAQWRIWLPLVAISAVLPPIVLAMPLVEKELVDVVILGGRVDLIPRTVALYGSLWLLSTVCLVAGISLRVYLGERLTLSLRERLLEHYEALSVAFAHRERSGRTMSLFLNDAPALATSLTTAFIGAFGDLVALAVGAYILFAISWQLAGVTVAIPAVVLVLSLAVTRQIRPVTRQTNEKVAELTDRLQENLSGLRDVAAFGQGETARRQFGGILRDVLRLRMRLTLIDSAVQSGQGLFTLAATLVILGIGGYLVVVGQTTLGALVATRSLFNTLAAPARNIFTEVGSLQRALAAADRIFAFLDERPRVREKAGAVSPRFVAGEVAFEGVSFAYEPGRPVLRDVSFVAEPGQVVALVGPSGAGKSTLVSLIARFYDPDEGRVLLDGHDLRDLTLAGLRRHVGIVFQDTFLFATTIRENVAIGKPGAGEREIVAALSAANAWEFVAALPEGLETQVGERGVRLSEGQKQRIAIARAFLRDPRLLILDEPTSALDARSDHLLQLALDRLVRDRTTFVIAHRLSTVRRADLILVVEDGRIVEHGTHDELMRLGRLYRELHDLQFATTDRFDAASEPTPVPSPSESHDRTGDSAAAVAGTSNEGERV